MMKSILFAGMIAISGVAVQAAEENGQKHFTTDCYVEWEEALSQSYSCVDLLGEVDSCAPIRHCYAAGFLGMSEKCKYSDGTSYQSVCARACSEFKDSDVCFK